MFIALTPNENYWWYPFLALYRGISTGHLTTDSFLTRSNSSVIVCQPCSLDYSYWTFIPKGEVLRWMSSTLGPLDRLGRLRRIIAWRGGLILSAAKYV